MERILVIAEAGVNHNGDIALAHELIEAAADAGADMVKFQTFKAKTLVTREAKQADYQVQSGIPVELQFDMLRRLEITPEMHSELIGHCEKHGIAFLSTGFDIESVNLLNGFGMAYFKVPSGEITNLPYLRHIGSLGKQIILSTGMANLGEIEAAINVLEAAGTHRDRITVLHCTTEYPTLMSEVNLRAMQSISTAFGVKVGYSDHTPGIEVATAAAALGGSVIEKHFTMDRNLPGPDHKASLEPSELKAMISAIRNIEAAMGDGIKRPSESERRNLPFVRKSLVAKRDIAAGEAYSEDNIAVKRPNTGLSPMRWDEVMGRKAPRAFKADELIEL